MLSGCVSGCVSNCVNRVCVCVCVSGCCSDVIVAVILLMLMLMLSYLSDIESAHGPEGPLWEGLLPGDLSFVWGRRSGHIRGSVGSKPG